MKTNKDQNRRNARNFDQLGLHSALVKAIKSGGYTQPTPIQAQAIPPILEGKDVMGAAQTGTGKTAGFALPILHRLSSKQKAGANQARALILTPTRELASQVGESVQVYGRNLSLKCTVVFGGVGINPQMMKLRKGVDVLVATPGRLLDLHTQNAVKFRNLDVLVLDEADRMLDMGFLPDIKKIIAILPKQRQTLMFSATFSDDIRKLAKSLLRKPVEVSVAAKNSTVKKINQRIHPVDKSQKTKVLISLIEENDWQQALVFTKTKHGANRLTKRLSEQNIKAAAIHGNKSQGARTKALADFKNGKIRILIATDIAARGLDISQLPQVVNFDLPNVAEDYVHRIGRTGRAGANGEAVSLVSADEVDQLRNIENLIQRALPREFVDDFIPNHDVPNSVPKSNRSPARRKVNPKKKKRSNQKSTTGKKKTRSKSTGSASGKPGKRNLRN
ncbi:MAG: DEAD/DEAH box helicase [Pseudomonadota bacterium]